MCVVGELKTATSLDREKVELYSLVARATDGGGLSCEATVSIQLLDVNDNPPRFGSTHYETSVYENTAAKALLTQLNAIDPDLGMKYIHAHTHTHIRSAAAAAVVSSNLPCIIDESCVLSVLQCCYMPSSPFFSTTGGFH